MELTLEEGLEIIRREMTRQAENHRNSALKKVNAYKKNGNFSSLIEGARLDVTADALKGVGKALTVEKVKKWCDDSGGRSE